MKQTKLNRTEAKIWRLLENKTVSRYYFEEIIRYDNPRNYVSRSMPTNRELAFALHTTRSSLSNILSKMYQKKYFTLVYENRKKKERLLVRNIRLVDHKNTIEWL